MKELEKNENLQEIIKNNDIVVLDFYAEWCGPCKMMKPIIEKLAEVTTDVVFVGVDIDKHSEIAKKFEVQQIPTLVVYKGGQVTAREVGFRTHDQLIKLINL